MSYSLFSSYGKVTIYDAITHKKYDLWESGGENVFPFVTDIDVNVDYQTHTEMSFSINAPLNEGLEMLDSTVFMTTNLVTIQLGYYDGDSTPIFAGILNKGGVGLSISPNGVAGQIAVTYQTPASYWESDLKGDSVTALNLVKILANNCGYKVLFNAGAKDRLTKLGIVKSLYPLNNFDALKMLIYYAGNEFHVEYETDSEPILLISVFNNNEGFKNGRYFEFRGRFDPEGRIYPILNFSPSNHLNVFSPPSTATKTKIVSHDKKGIVRVVSSQAQEDKTRKNGDTRVVGTKDRTATVKKNPLVIDKKPTANEASKRLMATHNESKIVVQNRVMTVQQHGVRNDGITATIESIGIPDIKSGEIIRVRGLGKLFNSDYTIRKVNHKWNGSLSTSLTIDRISNYSQKSKKG